MVFSTAWVVLCWEALWPLLVPLFISICVFLTFSWAGGWQFLHAEGQTVLLWLVRVCFIGAFLGALWPIRLFRLPEADVVTRRVETESRLENRPITANEDTIAFGRGDTFAKALWEEHQKRMADKLHNLTAGIPAPKANRFDPLAVRAMLPLLAFAAFFYSFSPYGGQLSDAYKERRNEIHVAARVDA